MQEAEMASWHEPLYAGREHLYGPRISVYLSKGFSHSAKDYVTAAEHRRKVQQLARRALTSVDALLTPTTPGPAPRDLTQTGDTRFQSPWSYTGFPSISLPIGLSGSGLPLGAQLAGAPFEEARLLGVAAWVERTLGVELSPPL
jgi:Asp-tRNA(Asn)/Glu-tRNA(Gln) amidotransferase A subunit family amidase